jgi:hypothetical protein
MAKARKMCFDKILPRDLARPHQGVLQPGRLPVRAISPIGKQWQNGQTITITFKGGTTAQKQMVRDFAPQWTEFANLTFEFVDDPAAQVRVSFDANDGAWSYVGTDNLEIPVHAATMNLGWQDQSVILHEFGHMIGLSHEHQNPQGGIQWDEEAVIADLSGPPNFWDEATIRHNVLEKYAMDQILGTEFDPESIMLYAFPNEWTIGDFQTEENDELSKLDKDFVRSSQMYPREAIHQAPLLPINPSVAAAIAAPGEQDTFRLQIDTAGDYVIETGGTTDVVMSLYGPNSSTKLRAQNDDGGRGPNARVEATLSPGDYVVQVRHYRQAGTGPYRIWVTG